MARCLISFGANIGQPAETIRQAAEQLEQRLSGRLQDFYLSRLFRTPAVGGPVGQPPFLNAVAALDVSGTTAWDVWQAVREIEHALGRVRVERWEARRIDLDVLLFEDQRIWTPHFKLPHPRMVMRRFILEPALDVAPNWRDPVSGMTISQLAANLRSGPASILLVGNNLSEAQKLLERAARTSGSQWLTPEVIGLGREPTAGGAMCAAPTGRWLGLASSRSLCTGNFLALRPAPKLIFVLAEPSLTEGAAWEDVHRAAAAWLGLCDMAASSPEPALVQVEPTAGSRLALDVGSDRADSLVKLSGLVGWPLPGPRYLLACDDLRWTEHEIIAAMEAMDCPVEPLGGQ